MRDFYNNYASKLNTSAYMQDAAWKVDIIKSVIPNGCNFSSILDVGCGPAGVLEGLARGDNARLVGIDISDGMLEKAAKIVPNAEFVRVDISSGRWPFRDKEFDLVVLSDILEHVENPALVLAEASRVGSAVVVKVPTDKAIVPELQRIVAGHQYYGMGDHEGGHINAWSRADALKLLSGSGMVVRNCRQVDQDSASLHPTTVACPSGVRPAQRSPVRVLREEGILSLTRKVTRMLWLLPLGLVLLCVERLTRRFCMSMHRALYGSTLVAYLEAK